VVVWCELIAFVYNWLNFAFQGTYLLKGWFVNLWEFAAGQVICCGTCMFLQFEAIEKKIWRDAGF
jgi:hypothetical protein